MSRPETGVAVDVGAEAAVGLTPTLWAIRSVA